MGVGGEKVGGSEDWVEATELWVRREGELDGSYLKVFPAKRL